MLDSSDVARLDLTQGLAQGSAQGQGLAPGLTVGSDDGGVSGLTSDDMVSTNS